MLCALEITAYTIGLGPKGLWILQPTLTAWGQNSLFHTIRDKLGYSPKVSVLFADRLQSVNKSQGTDFLIYRTVHVVLGAAGCGAGAGGGGDGGRMGSMS